MAFSEKSEKGKVVTCSSFSAISEQYLLDQGGNQMTELNGSGAWVHTNVLAGGATYTAPAGTNPGGLHFHLKDPLGTRRVQLAAGSGAVEEYCLSDPFGDALDCYNPPGAPATADDATEHHFTGKERDSESGNDYFKARYLASTMGRFMTPDDGSDQSAEDPQSWNLYAYVQNNPLARIDPDGHRCMTTTTTREVFDGQVTHESSETDGSVCYYSGVYFHAAEGIANAIKQTGR